MSDQPNLHSTTDAVIWAKEFCKRWPTALCQVDGREGVETEEDFEEIMVGWFANAIMTGADSEVQNTRADLHPVVKPLEFEQNGPRDGSLWAEVPLGTGFSAKYTIEPGRKGYSHVEYGIQCHEFGSTEIWFGPSEGAIQAAQDHHRKCVLSALTIAPVTPERAAEVLLGAMNEQPTVNSNLDIWRNVNSSIDGMDAWNGLYHGLRAIAEGGE